MWYKVTSCKDNMSTFIHFVWKCEYHSLILQSIQFLGKLGLIDLSMPLLEHQLHPEEVGSSLDQANTDAAAVSSAEETISRLHLIVQTW